MARPRQWWMVAVPMLLAGGAAAFWLLDSPEPTAPPALVDAALAVDHPPPVGADSTAASPSPVASQGADQPVSQLPAPKPETGGNPEQGAVPEQSRPAQEGKDSVVASRKELESLQEDARQVFERDLAQRAEELKQLAEKRDAAKRRATALKFKVTLGGTVVTARGDLVAQASIHVRTKLEGETETASLMRSWQSAGFGAGRTDAEGNFRFDFNVDVPEGTQQVKFLVSARRPMAMTPRTEDFADFTLANGGVKDDLRLQLRPEGKIKGRMADTEGMPVAGASVQLNFALPDGGGMMSITSGTDGTFTFEAVEPMDYIVTAQRGGLRTKADGLPASVAQGQATQLGDIVLEPSAVLVVELSGTGTANKTAQLEWFAESGTRLSQTSGRTDENGEVHFSQVPAGTLRFVIRCPGCAPTERLTTRLAPGETYRYGAIALTAAKGK